MKKLLQIFICLLILMGCASESKSFENIGKQYVQNYYYGEREKVLTDLVHEDFFYL